MADLGKLADRAAGLVPREPPEVVARRAVLLLEHVLEHRLIERLGLELVLYLSRESGVSAAGDRLDEGDVLLDLLRHPCLHLWGRED